MVLTTEVPSSGNVAFAAQKIAEQPVGAHGRPERMRHKTLAKLLEAEPLILPTESVIRAGFENLVAKLGIQPHIVASVDDMAMVRLLAREGTDVAIAPAVVLADEIASGTIATAPYDLGIAEPFYAVTLPRTYPHPSLQVLLE